MMNNIIEGIIIEIFDYNENDKIFKLYSKDNEIISFYAKGVKKRGSKNSPKLDLNNHVVIEYNHKITKQIQNLIRLDVKNYNINIRNDMVKLNLVLALYEIILKLEGIEIYDNLIKLFNSEDYYNTYYELIINLSNELGIDLLYNDEFKIRSNIEDKLFKGLLIIDDSFDLRLNSLKLLQIFINN